MKYENTVRFGIYFDNRFAPPQVLDSLKVVAGAGEEKKTTVTGSQYFDIGHLVNPGYNNRTSGGRVFLETCLDKSKVLLWTVS